MNRDVLIEEILPAQRVDRRSGGTPNDRIRPYFAHRSMHTSSACSSCPTASIDDIGQLSAGDPPHGLDGVFAAAVDRRPSRPSARLMASREASLSMPMISRAPRLRRLALNNWPIGPCPTITTSLSSTLGSFLSAKITVPSGWANSACSGGRR